MTFTDFSSFQRVGSNKRWKEQEMENAFHFTPFANDFVLAQKKGKQTFFACS